MKGLLTQQLIAVVRVTDDLLYAKIFSGLSDRSFAYPTTAALAQGRLLVVNSQFNRRGPGLTPDLPFTVSSVPAARFEE
jgi:Cu-Zn family superoxide dismutase